MAFALAMPMILLIMRWLEAETPGLRMPISIALGLALLVGIKVTFTPMFMCGFLAVVGAHALLFKRLHLRALLGAAMCVSVIVLSGIILYAGDSQSLRFAPGDTSTQLMRSLGLSEPSGWGARAGDSRPPVQLAPQRCRNPGARDRPLLPHGCASLVPCRECSSRHRCRRFCSATVE